MSSWAIARCGVPAARALRTLSGTEPLDLATLDRLAYTGSRRFLERLLIASDAVPPRDSRLAWLEAWTEQLLSATEPEEHRRALRGYARWVVLRRVRDRPGYQPLTKNRADGAKRQLKIAHDFLGYLAANAVDLADCDQTHIDCWLDARPAPADDLRPFLAWLATQHIAGRLDVPPHPSSVPRSIATDSALTHRILHAPDLAVSDRVAGALVVLFAQPLVRITQLRVADSSSPTTRSGSASPPAPSSCRARSMIISDSCSTSADPASRRGSPTKDGSSPGVPPASPSMNRCSRNVCSASACNPTSTATAPSSSSVASCPLLWSRTCSASACRPQSGGPASPVGPGPTTSPPASTTRTRTDHQRCPGRSAPSVRPRVTPRRH